MTAVSSVGNIENDDGAGGGGVGGIGEDLVFKIDGNGDDEMGNCGTGDGEFVVVSDAPVAIAEIADGVG